MKLSAVPFVTALMLVPVLFAGCTPDTGYHDVAGVVTHNGQPVPKVFITFHPANTDVNPEAMAMTDEEGRFELAVGSTPGVPPGEHTVWAMDPAALNGGATSDAPEYQAVITKYAPGTSTYKVTIDQDETDLELKLD